MSSQVRIPTQLRKLTGGKAEVGVCGATIREVIDNLDSSYKGLREKIMDPSSGDIRRFIILSINGEDVRYQQGADTPVKDGDEITILPAIAGGA